MTETRRSSGRWCRSVAASSSTITVRREGARTFATAARGQAAGEPVGKPFATIKVRQWLALAAVEAGQLRLAYEESLAALDLIEQMAGYALLKGYFEIVLAQVWYQWNRLEEARELLRTVVHDAAAWQQLDLLGWGYADLMQVETGQRRVVGGSAGAARGGTAGAARALWDPTQAGCQRCERSGGWRKDSSRRRPDWAAGVVFPEGPWEGRLYDAFPVVMRVYFAEHRWREALELLERWSGAPGSTSQYRDHHHLSRPVAGGAAPGRQERTSTRDRSAPVCFDGTRGLPARVPG